MRARPRKAQACAAVAALLAGLWASASRPARAGDAGDAILPVETKLMWEGKVPARTPPPAKALRQSRRALVPLESAPFPYRGDLPRGDAPFFDVQDDANRGRTLRSGEVRWEAVTYADSRVLLHLPAGFDPRQPITIVLFLHGNSATLERDVEARQQVPRQVGAAGLNTALLAPQLAVDAPDSSAGKFWQAGALARFLDEAARPLAVLAGHSRYSGAFARARVVIVAYSGGYQPAAWLLAHGGAETRIDAVVLLDALYGELDHFATFIAARRKTVFVSAYGPSSEAGNGELEARLKALGLAPRTELAARLLPGSIVFQRAAPASTHANFVTEAWTRDPLTDLLRRLPRIAPRTVVNSRP